MYLSSFNELNGVEEDGGKGHNLKRLVCMNFNVPGGIVIGSSFYKKFYPPPPDFVFENDEILERQCSDMQSTVLSIETGDDVLREIEDYLGGFGENKRFAVRSSSTHEDLASAAFAGQHATYLNVPLVRIHQAVKGCLSSLWQKHAVLYRRHNGFDQKKTSMAVVVQHMIPSEVSGVAFSVDPVSGNLSHMLIEANFGLGESVVGGEMTTDSWIVDKNNMTIVERRISRKDKQIILDTDGGSLESETDSACRELPCLGDDHILRIATTAIEIEKKFGAPQDIEWAYAANDLFILQSRPETKIPPHYTRAESAERFPEPLTPLTWSYVEEAFNTSLEHSLDIMGISLATRPWFAMIENYIYGNQNAVELLSHFRPLDMSSLSKLEEQIPDMQSRFQWIIDLPQYWLRDLDLFLLKMGRLHSISFENYTMVDFQSFSRELFQASSEYFKPNIAISMTQALLTRTLFEYTHLITNDLFKAQDLFRKILAASGTKTGQINREIHELAQQVKKNEGLMQLLSRGGESAWARIADFGDFENNLKKFMDNYGHREVTFDYYHPTWAEAPWVILDLICLSATSELSDPAQKELDSRMISVNATHELLALSPETIRYFISELIRLTATFSWLDDLEHFQTTRINLLVRKVLGAMGERFFKGGFLENKFDLFFLKKSEIEELKDFALSVDIQETICRRKREYFEAFDREPLWDLNNRNEQPSVGDNILHGVPGSPGIAEGEIFIVRGPADFKKMPNGIILVAKTTNPSWTPLFYKAKGLITESGGPLSHGAVTARELGLPAIMFIRNALKIFNNGERVRVNGQKGEVTRL